MVVTRRERTRDELLAYFWTHVDRRGDDECWPWTGSVDQRGYGRTDCGRYRMRSHRLAWLLFKDTPPPTEAVDHLCHNRDKTCLGGATCQHRRCANPAHTRGSTKLENLRAGRSAGTIAALGRTHCPNKHPLSGANLYLRKDGKGGRDCRKCRAAAEARRRTRIGNTCDTCGTPIANPKARNCHAHRQSRWDKR